MILKQNKNLKRLSAVKISGQIIGSDYITRLLDFNIFVLAVHTDNYYIIAFGRGEKKNFMAISVVISFLADLARKFMRSLFLKATVNANRILMVGQ